MTGSFHGYIYMKESLLFFNTQSWNEAMRGGFELNFLPSSLKSTRKIIVFFIFTKMVSLCNRWYFKIITISHSSWGIYTCCYSGRSCRTSQRCACACRWIILREVYSPNPPSHPTPLYWSVCVCVCEHVHAHTLPSTDITQHTLLPTHVTQHTHTHTLPPTHVTQHTHSHPQDTHTLPLHNTHTHTLPSTHITQHTHTHTLTCFFRALFQKIHRVRSNIFWINFTIYCMEDEQKLTESLSS